MKPELNHTLAAPKGWEMLANAMPDKHPAVDLFTGAYVKPANHQINLDELEDWDVLPQNQQVYPHTQQDMRTPLTDKLHLKDYPLKTTGPASSNTQAHELIHFNHHKAKELITHVNLGIDWLNDNPRQNPSQQNRNEALKLKLIDALGHYADEYWLPLILERFTQKDWQDIATAAGQDQETAHFFSLLIAHLCYNANSEDITHVNHAISEMKKAGIELTPIALDQPKAQAEGAERTIQDKTNPVIGFLLRQPNAPKPYWILGMAGTQPDTLMKNVEAHCKFMLDKNQHWGYSEYYKSIVKPSLTHLLQSIENESGKLQIPQHVHFAGHSLGGAIAHFTALDFPPLGKAAEKPKLMIHANNSPAVGNLELHQKLGEKGAEYMLSNNLKDVVATVPPQFLGYINANKEQPLKPMTTQQHLNEMVSSLKLLGQNWREGFIRHHLSVFLLLYIPQPLRETFINKALFLPTSKNALTLDYKVNQRSFSIDKQVS